MDPIELKHRALEQVRCEGKLPSEVARELGLSSRLLYRWLREPNSPHQDSHRHQLQTEIRKLTLKLQQLRSEMLQLERQS